MSHSTQLVNQARNLLRQVHIMTLATADQQGKPWVSPVGFVHDGFSNLYWISSKDAQHSKNIRLRPQIAISVYGRLDDEGKVDFKNGAYQGLYIDAEAHELSDASDIQTAITQFQKVPQPARYAVNTPSDVTGAAAWRIYQAVPKEFSLRIDATQNGQAITARAIIGDSIEKNS